MIRDLDIFVLSSLAEGFPFAALEAMAAGKPSVMTRCGGPEEVLTNGETGFLVPVADPQALAGKILELVEAPRTAAAMGKLAREEVERRYSLTGMLANYERLYARLCRR